MLSSLIAKNRNALFTNGFSAFSLKKVQVQFRQLQTPHPNLHDTRQLNYLVNAYIFREFNIRCHDTQSAHPVLQKLKSPGYRATCIQRIPTTLHKLLRAQLTTRDNIALTEHIAFSPESRQQALHLANHSPFIHCTPWFNHFSELQALDRDEFSALLCATLLQQYCLHRDSTAAEIQLFSQGVCSGYINLQLARENGFNPLHAFLMPLIHFIGLLLIYRELAQHSILPNAQQLLTEIDQINLKLGYWVAKDWGLPEDILYTLKERFLLPAQLTLSSELMQKSEHAYLAILLCQQGLLNRRQTESFLRAMGMDHHGFMEHAGITH